MSKNASIKNPFKNFKRFQSLITLPLLPFEEKNLKSLEEWIYGIVKNPVSRPKISFKNQKAFNGYQKNRIDCYKSSNFIILSF